MSYARLVFTPLHRELGLGPTPSLTFEMIEQAVQHGVLEQEDLDWKAALSESAGWVDEFAKDVASMANGGGGMIVVGVREDRKTSAASELQDVGLIDQEQEKKLRSAAFSGVRPAIVRLTFDRLQNADGSIRVLAVSVPPSVDAPHLVTRNQLFGIPVRVGRQTEWMQEWQIERAYRARFRGQEERAALLDTAWGEEAEALKLRTQANGEAIWMLMTAIPVDPVPVGVPQVSAEEAHTVLFEAGLLAERVLSGTNSGYARTFALKPGRRRWQTIHTASSDDAMAIGHDGSVVYAKRVGGYADYSENSLLVLTSIDLERAVAAGVSIVAEAGRRLSTPIRYRTKVGLVWQPRDQAIVFGEATHPLSGKVRFDEPPYAVFRVYPETVEVDTGATEEDLRTSMREIALALTSQGGLSKVSFLNPRRA